MVTLSEEEKKHVSFLLMDRNAFNEYIYTPLPEAYAILQARRWDENLKKKVMEYIGNDIPEPFLLAPRSVITRSLVTPNREIAYFIEKTKIYENFAPPSFFEYLQDKLVFKNPFKHSLVQFQFGSSFESNPSLSSQTITINAVNKRYVEGLKINQVQTIFGDSLVELHHRFFFKTYPHLSKSLFDCSTLFEKWGSKPDEFYKKFFALFVYHGVLFENYLFEKGVERDFIQRIILPHFIRSKSLFGVRPLIVSLDPIALEEADNYWNAYPMNTYPIFKSVSETLC